MKELRERAGYASQDAAAVAVGVNQTTVSRLERGDQQSAQLRTLEKFARAYRVELGEIVAAVRASAALAREDVA